MAAIARIAVVRPCPLYYLIYNVHSKRMRLLRVLFPVLLLVVWAGPAHAQAVPPADRHVIVISIDGLLPKFYLPGTNSAPNTVLVGLREQGSHARAMLPIYPSVTYASHGSLSTAVTPSKHGINANNALDTRTGNGRGLWYASDFKVRTIWDAAKKAGLTVGALSWPTTAGSSNIDWNLPEFWTTPYGQEPALVRKYESGGVVEIMEKAGRKLENVHLDIMAPRDSFMTAAAVELIRLKKPNLLFVHLIDLDHTEHVEGPNSPAVADEMERLDGHVREIVYATRAAGIYDRTTFIILGDHGSSEVQLSLAPNSLLAKEGLIRLRGERIESWDAIVQNTGGSAAVYVRDGEDDAMLRRVRNLFEKHRLGADGKPLYTVIDRPALTRLGGPAGAAFYLEGEPGVMFSGSLGPGNWSRRSNLRGNHGYLPTKPDMHTGFIAFGRGIRKGVELDTMRVTDVAPTVAALLGFPFESTQGRVLREILK